MIKNKYVAFVLFVIAFFGILESGGLSVYDFYYQRDISFYSGC